MTKRRSVTSRGINGHAGDGETFAASNANGLNRSVLDGYASDCRVGQAVGREKLRLRLATAAATIGVPPTVSLVCALHLGKILHYHRAPPPSRMLPEAPVTVMPLPPMFRRGPAHSE